MVITFKKISIVDNWRRNVLSLALAGLNFNTIPSQYRGFQKARNQSETYENIRNKYFILENKEIGHNFQNFIETSIKTSMFNAICSLQET